MTTTQVRFFTLLVFITSLSTSKLHSQALRFGAHVPREVETIYENGLSWLASVQSVDGSWRTSHSGPGVTALCAMTFLAAGEDPNFSRYGPSIRRAIRHIIAQQDVETGYFGSSMYHHAFAMLALAEAYGAVNDSLLWHGDDSSDEHDSSDETEPTHERSIARSLDLAIRCAVNSQRLNALGGWRYLPDKTDADPSATGTVLMGLLACRNAGLTVPDATLVGALDYLQRSTGVNGYVTYSGGFGASDESVTRSAVAALVYAVSGKAETAKYQATLKHITERLEHEETTHPHYFLYYMAQALFQGDYEAWEKWNAATIRKLTKRQAKNGSFKNDPYQTSMSLLALALNHRLLPVYER